MLLFFVLFANSRIIITEVMSNVKGPENPFSDRNEFVEIYNQSADTVDLSHYFISDFDAPPDKICSWENESILIKYPDVRIRSTIIYPYSYGLIMDREYIIFDTVNAQPYTIPESTLIITTDDTSIGDGLAFNDPLIIFSTVDSCTTNFGTPYIADNFPFNPGDGISWERIDYSLPDTINNWHPCIDPAGCTPGKENSTTGAFDLGLSQDQIYFIPAKITIGEDVNIRIGIINNGLRPTNDYIVSIYDDVDYDSQLVASELLFKIPGELVGAFDTIFLYWTYKKPSQGIHNLGFKIDFAEDKNLANNIAFKTLQVLGKIGELYVSPKIFTPNGDGNNDRLQIDYRLPEAGGELTISIFNARGIKIFDVYRKEIIDSDKGTIYWNGESFNGSAPSGMYVVYLEYQYHNKKTKVKQSVVLAR